ncbi:hypothetical protein [Jatrophihabitans fulvus]
MTHPDAHPDAQPTPPSGAHRVVLHVGEPKTGTTFLQQVMWANRSALAAAGVMLPGARSSHHWRATQDLRDVEQVPGDPIGPHAGSWDRLVRQALRAPRTAVISHELLAAVNEQQAERAVRSFEGTDLHVVLSVRDVASLLPAEWQETIKHRNAREWQHWLSDVIDRESVSDDRRQWWFWRVHDTREILRIWGRLLPPGNVHVLTMPPRSLGDNVLWDRFAGILGIDPSVADLSLARANASLGLAEVELLRKVNQQLPEAMPNWFYMHNVKDLLAHEALSARPSTRKPVVPARRDPWLDEYADQLIGWLADSPYDVVGDLEELRPRRGSGERPEGVEVPAEEQLGAAVDAIVALLAELATARGVTIADGDATERPPATGLKRALIAASERNQSLHVMRRQYWHLRNTLRTVRNDHRARREAP